MISKIGSKRPVVVYQKSFHHKSRFCFVFFQMVRIHPSRSIHVYLYIISIGRCQVYHSESCASTCCHHTCADQSPKPPATCDRLCFGFFLGWRRRFFSPISTGVSTAFFSISWRRLGSLFLSGWFSLRGSDSGRFFFAKFARFSRNCSTGAVDTSDNATSTSCRSWNGMAPIDISIGIK